MSWGSASTSTRSPAAAALAEVIGPIETMRGSVAIGPTMRQKLSTVDDDVNVIASMSPARTRARSTGSGSAVTVR